MCIDMHCGTYSKGISPLLGGIIDGSSLESSMLGLFMWRVLRG